MLPRVCNNKSLSRLPNITFSLEETIPTLAIGIDFPLYSTLIEPMVISFFSTQEIEGLLPASFFFGSTQAPKLAFSSKAL